MIELIQNPVGHTMTQNGKRGWGVWFIEEDEQKRKCTAKEGRWVLLFRYQCPLKIRWRDRTGMPPFTTGIIRFHCP